jgi:hypothetical protein
MPQSRILYNGARNDYPAFWNRFCQKLSEEGIYYVIEPNYRRLTVGNTPAFPAMPELNEMGQMTPVVKHAHEERMENYKIHMRIEIVEPLPEFSYLYCLHRFSAELQSMVDVGMLRQSITDLTDKDGYVVLMAKKVEELQNQLRQVKVKDAEGNILLDAEGNERRNRAMTDAELYGTYFQKCKR